MLDDEGPIEISNAWNVIWLATFSWVTWEEGFWLAISHRVNRRLGSRGEGNSHEMEITKMCCHKFIKLGIRSYQPRFIWHIIPEFRTSVTVQLCTTLYNSIQLYTILYNSVQLLYNSVHLTLCNFVQLYATLYNSVQLSYNSVQPLYNSLQLCTTLIQFCITLYNSIQLYNSTTPIQLCTIKINSVQLCTTLYNCTTMYNSYTTLYNSYTTLYNSVQLLYNSVQLCTTLIQLCRTRINEELMKDWSLVDRSWCRPSWSSRRRMSRAWRRTRNLTSGRMTTRKVETRTGKTPRRDGSIDRNRPPLYISTARHTAGTCNPNNVALELHQFISMDEFKIDFILYTM